MEEELVQYASNEVKEDKKEYKSFEEMDLKENLLRGIFKYGFKEPSRIQAKAIPLVLTGRDLIAQSQSGTGKTGTFAISTLQTIDDSVNKCQAIVLAPTRELAQQILLVFRSLSQYTKTRYELCVGGTSINTSIRNFRRGVHIVIGTPGRVYHMIESGYLNTQSVKLLMLDEADELLRGSFIEQMKNVVSHLSTDTQICLFSATMPDKELDISRNFLNNPLMILVEKEKLSLKAIKQFYINVVQEQWKFETLCDIYESVSINKAMIYVNTKERAEKLGNDLQEKNFTVSVIHSGMSSLERLKIMDSFRKGETRILVSTDLLARGIDVQQVSIVVNYDFPRNMRGKKHYLESYLHRIGRSGRFGKKGVAINFITKRDIYNLQYLENHYGITIEEMPENIIQFL